jgi:fatty-acyl-CoA synthase
VSAPDLDSTVVTLASLLRARADDDHPGYLFEDESYTWRDVVARSAERAAMIGTLLDPDQPPHIGVLLDNVPEYLFWAGGAALAGATIVGINPTRRGAELANDIAHTHCQVVVTDATHAGLLADVALPDGSRTVLVDAPEYADLLAQHRSAPLPARDPAPDTLAFLLFTSGSTSAPKAVRCTNGRMGMTGIRAAAGYGVNRDDVSYCPMPLFHGNALMACWAPSLATGATVVLRRRFSASGFLPDVRRYGCTFFTYVGRTIAYVLAQPPTAHDTDHRLRLGFGTEASAQDRERFAERFGCPLVEGYGSSESVIVITRTPETPPNALGVARTDGGADIAVVDQQTTLECPPAIFDDTGRIVNPSEAIGELVNRSGSGTFEGYYNNDEADADRLRNGWYWSGDLGYRDAEGFFYFAGRGADWLRVDSENFAAAPLENILHRFPGAVMLAVYPVPDPRTGDQVMVAIEFEPGHAFDPDAFADFLAAQPDLGTKWAPRFVRVVDSIPLTANNKLHKPPLRADGWQRAERVWWRPERELRYVELSDDARAELHAEFAAHDRTHLL